MHLKIIEIKETGKPWKPEGKNYTIYSVLADIEIDGTKTFGEVKTFSNEVFQNIKNGAEFDKIEKNDYQGKVSYIIKSEKKSWNKSNYQRITYTDKEFFDLVQVIYEKTKKLKDIDSGITFGSMLNNARQAGVKINNTEKNDTKQEKKDNNDMSEEEKAFFNRED